MSVLIKGMEMPKSCDDCPLNYDSIDCMVADNALRENGGGDFLFDHERHPNCPLIPIPPHGRLIDADKEMARVKRLYDNAVDKDPEMGCVNVYEGEIAVLQLAPTVIPASDKDTNVLGKEEGE